MATLLEVKTTKRFQETILVDISDEACLEFGFSHDQVVICPNGLEATILGVAPGNEGDNVLWYTIDRPRTQGQACYWGGAKNLIKDGFTKKIN